MTRVFEGTIGTDPDDGDAYLIVNEHPPKTAHWQAWVAGIPSGTRVRITVEVLAKAVKLPRRRRDDRP